MKTSAITFSLFLTSILLLSGCASYGTSKGWRQEKTVVEPYPVWRASYMGGDFFPQLQRVHNLRGSHDLVFPHAKWGMKYVVLARYQKYRSNPKNRDDGSRESYVVEKIISETPVESGTCFEMPGDFTNINKSVWESQFNTLFRPNKVFYQDLKIEKMVAQFFQDKKAQRFVLKACFGAAPELEVRIVDFRFDE